MRSRSMMHGRLKAYMTTTVSYFHMDGSSKFLKCCTSAAITAIASFIIDLALLTEWNQQLKDRLNWHDHS